MLLPVVSAAVAVRTIMLECLGLVERNILNPSFENPWYFFPWNCEAFLTCHCFILPHARSHPTLDVLSLRKTSQHKFTHAESRWFHLDSDFSHSHHCGVGEWDWNDSACKRGKGNGRGCHSSAGEERGETHPKAGLCLINGVLTSTITS